MKIIQWIIAVVVTAVLLSGCERAGETIAEANAREILERHEFSRRSSVAVRDFEGLRCAVLYDYSQAISISCVAIYPPGEQP